MRCQCDAWAETGDACAEDLGRDAVTIRFVPSSLKESARHAASNRGYTREIRVAPACAAYMRREDPDYVQ